MFEELLRRHPTYEVTGDPVYVPSTLTREPRVAPDGPALGLSRDLSSRTFAAWGIGGGWVRAASRRA